MVAKICIIQNSSIHNSFNLISKALIFSIIYLITLPHLSWAKYTYNEILPPGWQEAEARDINNSGIIAGSGVDEKGNFKGFFYRNGIYKPLIPPGWKKAFAQGINNSGDIVGHGLDSNFKGFLYSNGVFIDIFPPNWWEAYAYAVNDNGAVVGYGRDGKTYKGFLYYNGTYTVLLPSGWKEAYAYGINNRGDVAGYGRDGKGKFKGFLYSKETYTELLPPGWNEAKAFDINDNGELVGYGSTANNNFMGFLYRNGAYTEVSPPGWQLLEIFGINNSGKVVGKVLYKDGNMNGFMFDGSSYFTLLPAGWKWSQTYAINDNGDIIGVGSTSYGNKGFIATGTPDINVNPLAIFFGGNIKAGIILDKTVIVKNTGEGKLVIGAVTAPSFPFSKSTDNCSGQTLTPFATCKIIYSLILTSVEKMVVSKSDIPSNDPNKKSMAVTLGMFPDNDRDGYTLDVDCNDSDPSVNPGVTEIPNNNRDDDCNKLTGDF